MALALRGTDLLTEPEFYELLQGLDDSSSGSNGVLQAWWEGADVPPADLHRTLAIEGRLQATTQRSLDLINRVLSEIELAFPDEVPHA
jgi:hypothetical protein